MSQLKDWNFWGRAMKDSFSWGLRAGFSCLAVMAATEASAGYPYDEPSPFDAPPPAASAPAPDGWVRPGSPQAAFPTRRVRPIYAIETGTRIWFSSGKFGYKLFDVPGSPQLSQLDYTGLTGQSAEAFARFDAGNGFFVKGYLGGGSISGGKLHDQDFPPAVSPYSDTVSSQRNGDLRYLTIDAGYDVWSGGPFRLGGFVGYGYWNEKINTFGCAQTASGPVCTGMGVGGAVNVLDVEPRWNMLRVGGAAAWEFVPGFKIDVDAAYVRGYLSGADSHNLRPDIRNAPIDGAGNGFMIDAILSWQATAALSFGVGGRWWHVESDGEFRFDQTLAGTVGAVAQPLKSEQERYGLLLQANYKIGADASATPDRYSGQAIGPTWAGPYVGFNAGYGQATSNTGISGVNATAASTVASGFIPGDLSSRRAGVLAGGTVGYGWQVERVVYGIEADAGYAHIGGSTGRTDPLTGVVTTVDSNISWLGTVRGRIGRAFTQDVMAFVSGGAAFGGVDVAADVREASTSPCGSMVVCSGGSASKTALGWTVGAGVEVRLSGWASVKTEYMHIDLGTVGVTTSDSGAFGSFGYNADAKINTNLVRSGLNLRF
jgi:opacity protein-like surface antigen